MAGVLKLLRRATRLTPCLREIQTTQLRSISFALTDEQKEYQKLARRFSEDVIIPRAMHHDRSGEFPQEVFKQAWELGLVNMPIPKLAGGLGLGVLETCVIMEQLAYGCSGMAVAFAGNHLAIAPVLVGGNEELQKKYLGRLIEVPRQAAYAVTEPGGGSDVAAARTRAEKKGDEYILNGSKMFITNAGVANWFFVLARTDSNPGASTGSAFTGFIVDRELEGVSVGEKLDMMGQRASNTSPVFFDDVRVPKENVVGEEGYGFKLAMKAFDKTRPETASNALGVAQRALSEAAKYSLERKTMGKAICEHQMIQSLLADMAIRVESARWLTYSAGWQADQGIRNTLTSSIAKTEASRAAMNNAIDAVQVHGGYGYNKDYVVEKLMRDAKIFSIYEGTTEIQKVVISRDIIGRASRGEL